MSPIKSSPTYAQVCIFRGIIIPPHDEFLGRGLTSVRQRYFSNPNRYAGFFAGRFVLACAASQSFFVSSTNPSPLQAFCPLQSLRALLQADCPLQVLTPTQLSVASVAAFATPTSALLKSSAAVVAMTAPLPLLAPINWFLPCMKVWCEENMRPHCTQ
jgi:hypothetical protein